MADIKEWLIRRGKKQYLGPFSTETVRRLIQESELSPYDEIARSGNGWRYLKDSPPFSQWVEEIIPHAEEEQTIRLKSDETTAITLRGISRMPAPPETKPQASQPEQLVELTQKRHRVPRWAWIGVSLLLAAGAIWQWFPTAEEPKEPTAFPVEGVITEPQLRELSETFQQSNLLFYQGKVEESAGEYAKARQLYLQALKINPDDVRTKIQLAALTLLVEQDIKKTREALLSLLAVPNLETSQWVEIQNYLGLLDLKEGRYASAASFFLKALGQDDAFAPAHFNVGYSYFFQKQYYNARKHFDRAVQLQPDMPILYLYLGRVLQKLKDSKGAIQEYKNAQRINPNLYDPYLYLSFIYYTLNDHAEAFSYLRQMIVRDPEYGQDTYKDFRYMQEPLSYGFIIHAYSLMVKEKKLSSDIMAGLGLLHYLDGNKKVADSMVQQALTKNPQDAIAHTIHGYLLQKEKNYEEALISLRKALRYQYQNALAHTIIADIHVQLGWYAEALEHCRKVLVFDPFSVRAYYMLGVALTHLDRVSEGVESFNKALEYDSHYMPAKRRVLEFSSHR